MNFNEKAVFNAEVAKDAEKGVDLGVSTVSMKAISAVSRSLSRHS